jgi:hypothetical protein
LYSCFTVNHNHDNKPLSQTDSVTASCAESARSVRRDRNARSSGLDGELCSLMSRFTAWLDGHCHPEPVGHPSYRPTIAAGSVAIATLAPAPSAEPTSAAAMASMMLAIPVRRLCSGCRGIVHPSSSCHSYGARRGPAARFDHAPQQAPRCPAGVHGTRSSRSGDCSRPRGRTTKPARSCSSFSPIRGSTATLRRRLSATCSVSRNFVFLLANWFLVPLVLKHMLHKTHLFWVEVRHDTMEENEFHCR